MNCSAQEFQKKVVSLHPLCTSCLSQDTTRGTQRDDWYYRIKESFRDLRGYVRSRVMLNVGFFEEPHRPEDIRDIGKCLTYMHEHQGQADMLGNPLSLMIFTND